MGLYSIIPINYKFKSRKATYEYIDMNNKTQTFSKIVNYCYSDNYPTITLIDFLNGVAIPFILMIVCSIVTIISVLKVHRRIKPIKTQGNLVSQKTIRDIKFGMTMIALDLLYLCFNSPSRLGYLLQFGIFRLIFRYYEYQKFIYVSAQLKYIYINLVFYVQLLVNSVIRNEFMDSVRYFFNYIKNLLHV